MQEELVQEVARLMSEQTRAYRSLKSATIQLSAAMTRNAPESIEALARAGEAELTRMRARLWQITAELTKFTELRASRTEKTPLDSAIRQAFENSARELLETAREFQRVSARAQNLAFGGTSFTNLCIENCGIPPMTYRAPILRQENFDS